MWISISHASSASTKEKSSNWCASLPWRRNKESSMWFSFSPRLVVLISYPWSMKFIERFTGLVGSYDACKNCGATYKLLVPLPTHNSLKPPFALPLALSLASARHLHVLPLIMSPNLREENELEKKQQDKPSKASPGIGFKLLKKMGFKDGKGLGKYEDGILEPIMATKLYGVGSCCPIHRGPSSQQER